MATSKAKASTLADLTKKANKQREQVGEKPVKKFASKAKAEADIARTSAELKPAKKAALNDSTGAFTGEKADFNIDPLPKGQRTEPRDGSLRARALAKMQKGGLTLDDAVRLCREFDAERGKPTNEDTVARRAYELIRLVAIANGYGARQKDRKIIVPV